MKVRQAPSKVISQIIDHPQIKSITYGQVIPDELFDFTQNREEIRLIAIAVVSELKSNSFALQVIPGTHHKWLEKDEINCIIENCIPTECSLHLGGAIFINPLLLKRFSEALKKIRTQFVIIEFS